MTFGKRLRATMPVILVLLAFAAYVATVVGDHPGQIISGIERNQKLSWPASAIRWGMVRIQDTGVALHWWGESGDVTEPPGTRNQKATQ